MDRVSLGAEAQVSIRVKPEFQEALGTQEIPIAKFEPESTFGAAAGVAVRFLISRKVGIRVFGDYNYSRPSFTAQQTVNLQPDGTIVPGPTIRLENVNFSYLSVGLSVSAMAW